MALETATYVANLVATNPDGGDQRSTADDHLRLIKASLRRTFPFLDSALSLSAAQVHFVGDLSASVQGQLNALRDGPATANYAIQCRSASFASVAANALSLGGVVAASYARQDAVNGFVTGQAFSHASRVDVILNAGGTRSSDSFDLINDTANGISWILQRGNKPIYLATNGITRLAINADGTITAAGLITGTITTAQVASTAATAATATSAATATFANTCTSASSAATLGGYAADDSVSVNTVARRNSNGDVYARYFNQTSGQDNQSVGHIACMTGLDGYWRPNSVANLGNYLEARNITGRSGIAKTLSTSAPSGGVNGDIWYKY